MADVASPEVKPRRERPTTATAPAVEYPEKSTLFKMERFSFVSPLFSVFEPVIEPSALRTPEESTGLTAFLFFLRQRLVARPFLSTVG